MGRVLRWLIAAVVVFLFTSFILAQDKPPAASRSIASHLSNSLESPKE
jgi:hypothetical protein